MLDPNAVHEIQTRIECIKRDHAVMIPLAVESGSRAWGFPSPDSDYDCRFIFVRPANAYMSLWRPRDVIELPLEGEFDVNGWDLGKALKLLLKGNAVILEWLTSPLQYSSDRVFHERFLQIAHEVVSRDLIGLHYLHLGQRQRQAYFSDLQAIPLKKIFYAFRPAAAVRWLSAHPEANVAPMHFPTLLKECEAPQEVIEIMNDLLAKKAVTNELGTGPLPPQIGAFIDQEFSRARDLFRACGEPPTEMARQTVDTFFRETVTRVWS